MTKSKQAIRVLVADDHAIFRDVLRKLLDVADIQIVGEAANGPVMPEGDKVLEDKGIFLIPDILCNAGGVTVSYFEWVQDEQHMFWEAQDVYNRLERVMHTAFAEVLKTRLERKVSMRTAANMVGIGRVAEATRLRGLFP